MGLNTGDGGVKPEEADNFAKFFDRAETIETSRMPRDSFDDYKEMVDNFNKIMCPESEQQHYGGDPSNIHAIIDNGKSSLPSNIEKYDAEIWYPECRDCLCCRGFKHGCTCATSNNRICRCVTGVLDDVSVVTMNSYDLWYQQLLPQYPTESQCNTIESHCNPIERRSSRHNVNNHIMHEKVDTTCRFFSSSAGCRYGSSCPFNHVEQE